MYILLEVEYQHINFHIDVNDVLKEKQGKSALKSVMHDEDEYLH